MSPALDIAARGLLITAVSGVLGVTLVACLTGRIRMRGVLQERDSGTPAWSPARIQALTVTLGVAGMLVLSSLDGPDDAPKLALGANAEPLTFGLVASHLFYLFTKGRSVARARTRAD